MGFFICGGGNGCVISVPLWDHFMVGTSCFSTGDLCCVVGLEARPLERDLDLENPVFDLLGVVLDVFWLFRSEDRVCAAFTVTDFLFTLVTICSPCAVNPPVRDFERLNFAREIFSLEIIVLPTVGREERSNLKFDGD